MELRRHQRFPVHFHSSLSSPKLGNYAGTVIDLSKRGCRINTDIHVYTGMQLALLLHVPEQTVPISIERAAVAWARNKELGLGFILVNPQQEERLDRVIKRLEGTQQP